MKRSHHSLRRWVTTVALTAALLDSQLSSLAAESIAPRIDPSSAADADPGKAETNPTETNSTAADAPSADPPVTPSAAPVAEAAPAAPSPAVPAPTAQTIRLEAARQRVEAHLAAIVARDQAAKIAQLQQNLVAAALRYAEAGNFEQAQRTAKHPALPATMQAETLTKIAAIALLNEGAITAARSQPHLPHQRRSQPHLPQPHLPQLRPLSAH
ncbi:MAG: hypothetical protein HC895_16935 [Leptolyngbyaceae cyanobacterium SM1_3_5]|nr:hypothetical protein [Leptolyngbyaceae cyanobacterium SM1_3_5]